MGTLPPIPIPEHPDPQSNLVEFKPKKREPKLKTERRNYGDCEHHRVTVHEATRSVTCSTCNTLLDAFTVLLEMARKERRWLDDLEAWDARRESILSERYDAKWQELSRDIKEPPGNTELLRIWETFHSHLGESFCGMYQRKKRKRTGPLWYGRTIHGGCVSLDYAQSQLVAKIGVVPK